MMKLLKKSTFTLRFLKRKKRRKRRKRSKMELRAQEVANSSALQALLAPALRCQTTVS